MALSTIWYYILITIVAILPTAAVVVSIKRLLGKDDDFIGVLWLIGIFVFWISWECTDTLISKFSYTIITIENGEKHGVQYIVGTKNIKYFKNQVDFSVYYGKTYIDNCSDADIEIQLIEYSRYPIISPNGEHHNPVDQYIPRHSCDECKYIPDYYFESPNTVSTRKCKFSSGQEIIVKRLLVYSGNN